MDLTQVRYFLSLARTLNFTRAAEACNVTQPALTKSIQRLEGEFGGKLILRERSHTQLTELGRAMMPLLQQIFEAAESARTRAAELRRQTSAPLRIGLGSCVDTSVAIPIIKEINRRLEGLELTVLAGSQGELNDWLLRSVIDVGLTADADGLPERANRWQLFSDPVVALVPESCAPGDSWTAPPFGGAPFISRHGAEGELTRVHERIRVAQGWPQGASPEVVHRASTQDQVLELVRGGCGWALSTRRQSVHGGIALRDIQPAQQVTVYAAAMAGRPRPRAADLFLKIARARDWAADVAHAEGDAGAEILAPLAMPACRGAAQ